jgi:FtsZ-binding cell division protein ZapB
VDEAFALLEEKVQKAVSALKRLGAENAGLRRDLEAMQGRLKDAQKAVDATEKRKSSGAEDARRNESLQKELERLKGEATSLRSEREEVRDRIARLVTLLGEMEA